VTETRLSELVIACPVKECREKITVGVDALFLSDQEGRKATATMQLDPTPANEHLLIAHSVALR
jgi:hypothetical protein